MGRKKKILLIDDSDLVSELLRSFLEQEGFAVVRARNGVEGIEKTYKEIPDLIIMDVEMPVMQGYQASRMLKSRRGVKDIPIIMHTSLSEDKDKYWAYSSGADSFINKDLDNLDSILKEIKKLSNRPSYDEKTIKEDEKKIDREYIFEILGNLFNRELFQSTILNKLSDVSKDIGSISKSINSVLGLLSNVCEHHLAVILLKYSNQVIAFSYPSKDIFEQDVEDFLGVCLNDFFEHFSDLTDKAIEKVVFGISGRKDYSSIRIEKKRISSYSYFKLTGKGGSIIGTLHLGNFHNNYFSEYINSNISLFTKGAGIIIENSMLFNRVSEMEQKIRTVFAKFVPSDIIDDLVEKQSTDSLLLGEKREVAVLFSDIRSFTTISENSSAESIVSFLNSYFETMGAIIKKYGGTIDKFIGDAILAIFGAPKSYEDNAMRAAKASIEMIEALGSVKTDNLVLTETGLNIGIGIHEGQAIVGNIGFSDKFDYTIIGDTVNLASRLESLTKHYKTKVIVSEAVKDKVSGELFLREIDTVKVKGKDKPTCIYTVENKNSPSLSENSSKNYNKGLAMYKMRNWKTATEYFQKVIGEAPHDFISEIYLERCKTYIKSPPPDDWDGSCDLDFK